MNDTLIPVGATGKALRGVDRAADGIDEYVVLSDKDNKDIGAKIRTDAPVAGDPGLVVRLAPDAAVASYRFATLSSGSLALAGSLKSLRVFAFGQDGSFQIGAGDTILVRADTGFDWSPASSVISPAIVWVSGTLDVFAELR